MKTIEQSGPLAGKKILVRVDFNVPLDESGSITDDKRVREALPTINYILEEGGCLVLMSHLGRPKGEKQPKYSLKPVAEYLKKAFPSKVKFAGDCISEEAFKLSSDLKPGEILLLENLRFHKEEKKGDAEFSMKLAKHGDVYVNDAFGTAHRAHASTYTVAKLFKEKYAGFLLKKEIKTAELVLKEGKRPITAIMGGAKVSDKIKIIQNLLPKIDYLLIGGGMAYTFQKAQGFPVGTSLCENEHVVLAASILKQAKRDNTMVLTPVDSVVADRFAVDADTAIVRTKDFPNDMMGLDIGPETFKLFYGIIQKSKTILWNGPMGVFEMEPFASGTIAIGGAIAEATEQGAFSLIGGGDSAAAVKAQGLEDKVSYVSTGGGALLELMEGKVLPAVEALG